MDGRPDTANLAQGDPELLALLDGMVADGMRLRGLSIPPSEVLFVKSVLEAYPGLCSVHAPRGRVQGPLAPLVIACSHEAVVEVHSILDELEAEAQP